VSAAERRRVNWKETKTMDANDYYQQGLAIIADPTKYTAQGTAEARDRFETAIKLDPNFSKAYAELAYVHVREGQNGWSADRAVSLTKAEELARKALAMSDGHDSHWSLAIVNWNQGKFDESFLEYGTARQLNPNDPDLDADEAEALIYAGDPGKAIAQIQQAMSRNPNPPYWYWWNLGRAYYMASHYQEAIDAIDQISNSPKAVLLIKAASHAQLGNLDVAKSDMAIFRNYDPNWSIAKSAAYPYRNDSDRRHWLDGLRKAGLNSQDWP
jgi:adenylate cyclase